MKQNRYIMFKLLMTLKIKVPKHFIILNNNKHNNRITF